MAHSLLLFGVALVSAMTDAGAILTPAYKDPSAPVEVRVEDLLSRMTLGEKVLQLCQYSLGKDINVNNMGERLSRIPSGSGAVIYRGGDRELRNSVQRRMMEESRLGIPLVFGYDAIHGYLTTYQVPLGQACSWDTSLTARLCSAVAQELRDEGIEWTFSPMVDVCRDPRWGRIVEGYGEDPYVNSAFAAASVTGYQGPEAARGDYSRLQDGRGVAACIKHFVGYGASEAGRDYVYTEISDQGLWETWLPPFKAGLEAGAMSVMSAFNDISGIPASACSYTLTTVLRDKWGFDGVVVSDWGAVEQLCRQGYCSTLKDAAAAALCAGVDIDMQSSAYDSFLEQLVSEGRVGEQVIDEAVRRVLRLKFRLGLFEHPYLEPAARQDKGEEMKEACESMAAESSVLLKNDSALLPLRSCRRIAVIGPLADDGDALTGCWRAGADASMTQTILSAVRQEFDGRCKVGFVRGCDVEGNPDRGGISAAVRLSSRSDVVILCLGEGARWSGENASRQHPRLPEGQLRLLKALRRTGTPLALVLVGGRPLILSDVVDDADAILETWQPGTYGARSVAGIISGRINPSGRLAVTFPRSEGQIPIYYGRRSPARDAGAGLYKDGSSEPLFPFGYGLSYSMLEYSNLRVGKAGDGFEASVDVTNKGSLDAQEVMLWYIRDVVAGVTRPMYELKHFERLDVPAGETVTFSWSIDPGRDLSFVDRKGERHLESGDFVIYAGGPPATALCCPLTLP